VRGIPTNLHAANDHKVAMLFADLLTNESTRRFAPDLGAQNVNGDGMNL
jgi:hypothetical protein